jgi:hypothetical protein
MSSLTNLVDVEFEAVVADLLRAMTGVAFRSFRRSADGGVDVRFSDGQRLDVVQCKHLIGSTFSQLRAAAKLELMHLNVMDPHPTRYRFVTSKQLTLGQTQTIARTLSPWIRDVQDVWDGIEVERLLSEHETVLRRHVKLWLASGTALGALFHAATHHRSQALVSEVERALPRYLQTRRFFDAQQLLAKTGTCLIAGEPGIGKTTLAQMLLLDLANQGFEPIEVSADIEEAWSALTPTRPQAIYYDDFIHRNAATDRLAKNEDRRLVELIRHARRNPKLIRLIFTTREYILREATELYEAFSHAQLDAKRFLLDLPDYTRTERAQIFYNHVFHAARIGKAERARLLTDRAYLRIIDHEYYNPRVIEYITGMGTAAELPAAAKQDYVAFAIHALDHPDQIWTPAFREELNGHQQALLCLMATMPDQIRIDDLHRAFDATYGSPRLAFARSLRTLEVTFLRTFRDDGQMVVELINPSVDDFLSRVLATEPAEVRRLLEGAISIEQVKNLWSLGRRRYSYGAPSPMMRSVLVQNQADLAKAATRLAQSDILAHRNRDRVPRQLFYDYDLEFACFVRRLGRQAREVIDPWLDQTLAQREQQWTAGRGYAPGAVAVLRALHSLGRRDWSKRLIPVVRDWLMDAASGPDDFRVLVELRGISDDLFSADAWSDIEDHFLQAAHEAIEWGGLDEDELDNWQDMADELGVGLDEDEMERARESVAKPEPEYEPDGDRAVAPSDEELEDPDAEIDAMFNRLRDE